MLVAKQHAVAETYVNLEDFVLKYVELKWMRISKHGKGRNMLEIKVETWRETLQFII